MTYTFNAKKNAASPKPSAIDALNAPESAQKPANFDPAQQSSQQAIAKKKTLRTLNAIKIVSPILEGLILNPGSNAEPEELAKAFKDRVKTVSELSAKTCLMLGLDPKEENNFWIRNVFEHLFSQITKSQWKVENNINVKNIETLIQTILDHETIVLSEYRSMGLEVDNDVKIHLIRSVLPIITEAQTGFSLNRKVEDDIEHIMETVLNAAKNNIDKIVDENTDVKQRADLFKLLILEAGNLYAASWKKYAQFAKNQIDSLKPEERQKLEKKYPKGLPINKIDEEFHQYFDRLLTVTQKLIPPKAGTIDNRLKA